MALFLTAVGGWLRFAGLDRVRGYYWDETFYAADAAAYLGRTAPTLRAGHPVPEVDENSWMQPPLGKWAIAAGEWILGDNEWGWRAPSAIMGTAAVPLTLLLGLELTGSLALGALAGLLVALDGLEIVQSRIATLDIFAATLALAGLYVLVRAGGARARPSPAAPDRTLALRGPPPAYLLSGLLLGMAMASKWSGLPYLVMGGLLAWSWLPKLRPEWSLRRRAGAVAISFAAVPAAVYLASYTSLFTQNGPDLLGFLRLQWDMFQYGRHFDPGSVAASPAWAWPFLRGSIDYTQAAFLGGGIRIVGGNVVRLRTLAVGNPVLWWAFLASAGALLWRLGRAGVLALRRRNPSEPGTLHPVDTAMARPLASSGWGRPELVALGGYGAAWLPWLVPGRTEFVYYLLPAVPFMAVSVALAVRRLGEVAGGRGRPVAVTTGTGLAAGAAAAAWSYYPLWVTLPVGYYTFARLTHLPGVH